MENHIQLLHFALFDEANKLLNLIKTCPSEHATLCNNEDLNALPFHERDIGFFMVVVPGKMHEKHGNFSFLANENKRKLAQVFLSRHTVQQLSEELLLVSTTCTWDLVPCKVRQARGLGYAAIAFTTPERLQILAENPQNIR
jgi:hypothetical protein